MMLLSVYGAERLVLLYSYLCHSIPVSLLQCFYCGTEKEFDDLCNRIRQELIDAEKTPLFELVPTRPDYMRDDATGTGASGISEYP